MITTDQILDGVQRFKTTDEKAWLDIRVISPRDGGVTVQVDAVTHNRKDPRDGGPWCATHCFHGTTRAGAVRAAVHFANWYLTENDHAAK